MDFIGTTSPPNSNRISGELPKRHQDFQGMCSAISTVQSHGEFFEESPDISSPDAVWCQQHAPERSCCSRFCDHVGKIFCHCCYTYSSSAEERRGKFYISILCVTLPFLN